MQQYPPLVVVFPRLDSFCYFLMVVVVVGSCGGDGGGGVNNNNAKTRDC